MVRLDTATPAARFYRCSAPACALRFPVTPADAFAGVCPRCGGPVTLVAARVFEPPDFDPHDVSAAAWAHPLRLHLLLDNWRSCFNVGSVFRTADGAGASMLHLCGITPTPAQPKVGKTALGAETTVLWRYHADGVVAAAQLKAAGARVWALETTAGAVTLDEAALPWDDRPLLLAAGNEIAGVDPGILALCDQVIALPMRGMKRSLNVAIALSVAVYWLTSRRHSASAERTASLSA